MILTLALLASTFHAPLPDLTVKDDRVAREAVARQAMMHQLRATLLIRRIPFHEDLGSVVVGFPGLERRFFLQAGCSGIQTTDGDVGVGVMRNANEAVQAAERWWLIVGGIP